MGNDLSLGLQAGGFQTRRGANPKPNCLVPATSLWVCAGNQPPNNPCFSVPCQVVNFPTACAFSHGFICVADVTAWSLALTHALALSKKDIVCSMLLQSPQSTTLLF